MFDLDHMFQSTDNNFKFFDNFERLDRSNKNTFSFIAYLSLPT